MSSHVVRAPIARAKSVNHTVARVSARRGGVVVARAAKKSTEGDDDEDEPGIDFRGLKQLVSMGLGTLSGDITEINLDDPKRTVVMELEANNFEDNDGKPLNFMNNDGFVDENGEGASVLNYAVPLLLGAASVWGIVATLQAL